MDNALQAGRGNISQPAPGAWRVRIVLAGLMLMMAALSLTVEDLPALLSPGYSLYQVVWMRYAAHLLALLLIVAPRSGPGLVHTRRPALQVGRGLLMLAMPFFFIEGLRYAHADAIMAVFWVAPWMVLALAALLQKDVAQRPTWLALIAGSLAVLLITRPDSTAITASGAAMAMGMAFTFSLYVVLTRTLRTEPTATNLFYTAAVVFAPLSLVMPLIWKGPTAEDLLIMALVGLASLGLLWALDRACAMAPVSLLAPWLLAQPVLAAVLAPLLTGTHPGKSVIVGWIVAVGAGLPAWWATQHIAIGERIEGAEAGVGGPG